MSFKEKLPEWYNAGLEPTEAQKKTGYTPGIKPPAQWFNWHLNRSYQVMKELQEKAVNIAQYTEEVTETLKPDVAALEDRLDNAKTGSVALQPGLTVVNSPKDARFRLGEMRGRTLINLLGNAGSCDSIVGWTGFNSPLLSVDSSTYEDAPSSIKVQQRGSGDTGVSSPYFNVDSSGYYVAVAFLRFPATGFTELTMYFEGSGAAGKLSSTTFNSGQIQRLTWMPVTVLLSPTQLGAVTRARIRFDVKGGASEDAFNVDSVRVYQITAEKYNELNGKAHAEISNQFPMCSPGIRGVDSPYAIATSDNLLPPFYEWTVTPGATSDDSVIEPYSLRKTVSDAAQPTEFVVSVMGGQVLTLSYKSSHPATAYINIQWLTGEREPINWTDQNAGEQTVTAPDNAKYARVIATTLAAGTFTFENPTLIVGSKPKPFKPQRKSMLAFQTELHADPNDGSDPDTLFEQDGQYFKLAKWKKVVLDGSLNYTVYGSKDGFRTISTPVPGAVYPSTVTDT
ncbi:hypothetical protein GNQ08_20640, partial [Paenibacillus macerans]|nr:hypothetical protein [Paenibacillus macerans]